MMPDPMQVLLARPDLPRVARAINETLAREQVRRERFRRELTPSVKAEFIGGEAVRHSPAKAKHLRATQNLMGLLRAFVQRHGLGEVFSEKALICLTRNDYEPDVVFFEKAKADRFVADQMEFPAPDFIAEVLSESTEQRDRGVKFDDYADHGVAEYWIIDCDETSVEQYCLRDGAYRLAQKLKQGEIDSLVVAGFRIPIAAIFDDHQFHATLTELLKQELGHG
jgi:Uma2 family endonuclease